MSFNELVKEYENLNNTQLADEFSIVNAYVELVWNNIDDETSDRWDVLSQMIHERFILTYGTSYLYMYRNPNELKA